MHMLSKLHNSDQLSFEKSKMATSQKDERAKETRKRLVHCWNLDIEWEKYPASLKELSSLFVYLSIYVKLVMLMDIIFYFRQLILTGWVVNIVNKI